MAGGGYFCIIFCMKVPPGISIRRVLKESGEWKTRFAAFYSGCEVKDVTGLDHAYFAAYAGDEIAGHSVIYLQDGRWVMDGLRVKPEFRERGIAKALTEARIRYALSRGAREVWYTCEDGNLVTACCHVRFGFRMVCDNEEKCTPATAHWYRLRVTPSVLKKFPGLRLPR